ncbi:MAG TPA: pirin family protein, partial [Prosthecobacter sp.]
AGESTTHDLAAGRGAWFQLISGSVSVNGTTVNPGDAVSTEDSGTLTFTASQDAEALFFDLA